MKMALVPLLVLALAVVGPSLSEDVAVRRCKIRDQLKGALSSSKHGEYNRMMATVVCEVEKFASSLTTTMAPNPATSPAAGSPSTGSPSSRPPTTTSAFTTSAGSPPNTTLLVRRRRGAGPKRGASSEEDSSEEKLNATRGAGADTYLRQCVAVNGSDITVDANCFRSKKVFLKVYWSASQECANVKPCDFFSLCIDCTNNNKPPSEKNPKKSEPKSESKDNKKSGGRGH